MEGHRLPTKRVSAAVIFRNRSGEILMVKPTYREGWLLPGGVVEELESPLEGAIREVREELGLEIPAPIPITVNYVRSRGEGDEGLQVLVDGGILDTDAISRIVLQENELSEFRFMPLAEAELRAYPKLSLRLKKALADGAGPYFEADL